MKCRLIVNEGATRPVSIGWARLEMRKIRHCGGGPEVVRRCPFRSGARRRASKIAVPGTMATKAGFGRLHLA